MCKISTMQEFIFAIFFFFFFFFSPRPRLKNIDRSSAQHLEVTVGDLTVIITDFKEKANPTSSLTSAASVDHHSQSGSSSDNTEQGVSRCSSPLGEGSTVNGETHWPSHSAVCSTPLHFEYLQPEIVLVVHI